MSTRKKYSLRKTANKRAKLSGKGMSPGEGAVLQEDLRNQEESGQHMVVEDTHTEDGTSGEVCMVKGPNVLPLHIVYHCNLCLIMLDPSVLWLNGQYLHVSTC